MVEIGLGTVQLGMPYGNGVGSPLMPKNVAAEILETALSEKIRFFDTAVAYGESEARLGEFGLGGLDSLEVSTKIPIVGKDLWNDFDRYKEFLLKTLENSRLRLGAKRLGLLQFHQHDLEFLTAKVPRSIFNWLLEQGFCESLGVSVYYPEEAFAALDNAEISALQVPINIIDQRFLSQDLIKLYREKNVRLIARSVLLQGLLVEEAALPPVLRKEDLGRLRSLTAKAANRLETSLHALSLSYVFGGLDEILDIALLGADSPRTLRDNIAIIRQSKPSVDDQFVEEAMGEARQFALTHGLVDPSRWNVS